MWRQHCFSAPSQLICCTAGSETYYLDMALVCEVQNAALIRRNSEAGSPDGWLVRNQVEIPVYRLATYLRRAAMQASQASQASQANQEGWVVVMQAAAGPWALVVDQIHHAFQVTAERIFPLPPVVGSRAACFFKGVVNLNGRLSLYLWPENLHPDAPPNVERTSEGRGWGASESPANQLSGRLSGRGQMLLFAGPGPVPRTRPLVFGVGLDQVLEIIDPPTLVPVPGAPDYVLGLIGWRNQPVPVIDLPARLGLGGPVPGEDLRFLIVRASSHAEVAGLPVRPRVKMQGISPAQQPCECDLPLDKSLTGGIYDLERAMLVVLDLDAILQQ